MILRRRIGDEHEGERLIDVLAAWLPAALERPLPTSQVRKLLMAGVVQLEGRIERDPGRRLQAGLTLEVAVDLRRLPAATPAPGESPLAILYEDDALIAVDKPVDLPTVPTADPSRPSLVRAVERYLARTTGQERPLGVHQRLDQDTSGVVLFVKDPRANPGLAEAFAQRTVEKVYDVVTVRPVSGLLPQFEVKRALAPRGRRGMAAVPDGDKGALPSSTSFTVRETFARALLLEARPNTGRKHQIRVHLLALGAPVLGDVIYGAGGGRRSVAGPAVPRLMLHARRLALRHPLTGEALAIESPWPAEFRLAVDRLRLESSSGVKAGAERGRLPRSGRPGGPPGRTGRAGPAAGRGTRGASARPPGARRRT